MQQYLKKHNNKKSLAISAEAGIREGGGDQITKFRYQSPAGGARHSRASCWSTVTAVRPAAVECGASGEEALQPVTRHPYNSCATGPHNTKITRLLLRRQLFAPSVRAERGHREMPTATV